MIHPHNYCRSSHVTIAVTVAIIGCMASQTGRTAELAERIHDVMASHFPADEPGAVALVAYNGEVVFRRAYGLASVELNVPVRPEMVFALASVTKLHTAVAAMMLVEEGALQLEDEVVDYLPGLSHAEGATIAHLLSHTSGLTGPIAAIPGYREENIHREISPDDLIASYADYPLLFAPGERFRYSNEGIAALGRIVELVSGQSWEQFLQQRIFEPVGMNSTYFGGHHRIIPMAVTGYTKHDSGWKRAQPSSFTRAFGMGALFSTVDDLFAWHNALLAGRLVKPETLESMFTAFPLNDGGHSRHGFGFVVSEINGHRFAGHGGGHFGWSTFLAILPDDGIFVTVLTNRSPQQRRARHHAMAIIELLLDEQAESG